MLIRYKLLLGFMIIIAITIPNGIIGYVKVEQGLSQIENDLILQLEDLKTSSQLNRLAVDIRYYDEVLTQAARNYAFTGDKKWAESYFETEPILDKTIREAIAITHDDEKVLFEEMLDTNTDLVEMERQSIDLAGAGRNTDAIAILESPAYWESKAAYKTGLERYLKIEGMEYDDAFDLTIENLEGAIQNVRLILTDAKSLLYVGIPIVLLIAVFLSYFVFKSISVPLNRLKQTVADISRGNYDVEFPKARNDEIGELAKRMETMLTSFKTSLETELQLTMAKERLKTEKLTAIGELAARIAHDLRNPLSVIKNVCEIMRMQYGESDQKIKEHITKMENSIQRMSHQIDDVLDYVRNTPVRKSFCSLREIIGKSVDDLEVPSDVTVVLPDNDEKINCDEQKMRTVISNIILNSIQAMDAKGTVTVKIRGYTKFVSVEISDTGPGIAEDALSKVFEPLFTTKQTGTGLGLSSCKSIVEQHNGTIAVKNNPTTFTITLPRL